MKGGFHPIKNHLSGWTFSREDNSIEFIAFFSGVTSRCGGLVVSWCVWVRAQRGWEAEGKSRFGLVDKEENDGIIANLVSLKCLNLLQ